jgi:hypothetical protein
MNTVPRLSKSALASYLQKKISQVEREKREWDIAGWISVIGFVFFIVQILKPFIIHVADVSVAVAAIYLVLLIVCVSQSVYFKGEKDSLIQELTRMTDLHTSS